MKPKTAYDPACDYCNREEWAFGIGREEEEVEEITEGGEEL